MRFVDGRGVEWEVWELASRENFADAPPMRVSMGGIGGEASWLCFESATQRRRLARYPARWHAMLSHELEALCESARPERPVMASRPRLGHAW
ncbi:MAG: hypothetical protein ACXWZS_05085 [Gemmatirosa sp.]